MDDKQYIEHLEKQILVLSANNHTYREALRYMTAERDRYRDRWLSTKSKVKDG